MPENPRFCNELVPDPQIASRIDLERFRHIHLYGRRLIRGWFHRAVQLIDCEPGQSFEPFIYTWIAFNGWGACVTGEDGDRAMVRALSASPELCAEFTRFKAAADAPLAQAAQGFHALWPIFKTQELRQKGLRAPGNYSRQERIHYYLDRKATEFAPACARRHWDANEPIPLDWPHTLDTIYRVRCNLFHGEKAIHDEMDQAIVHGAFQVLARFIRKTGCF